MQRWRFPKSGCKYAVKLALGFREFSKIMGHYLVSFIISALCLFIILFLLKTIILSINSGVIIGRFGEYHKDKNFIFFRIIIFLNSITVFLLFSIVLIQIYSIS